jgi:hypothetical protein
MEGNADWNTFTWVKTNKWLVPCLYKETMHKIIWMLIGVTFFVKNNNIEFKHRGTILIPWTLAFSFVFSKAWSCNVYFKYLPWCHSSSFVVWGSSTWKMIFFVSNLLTSHFCMFYATLSKDGIQVFWNEHWALNKYCHNFHFLMFVTSLHVNHHNDFAYFFNLLMDICLVYTNRWNQITY